MILPLSDFEKTLYRLFHSAERYCEHRLAIISSWKVWNVFKFETIEVDMPLVEKVAFINEEIGKANTFFLLQHCRKLIELHIVDQYPYSLIQKHVEGLWKTVRAKESYLQTLNHKPENPYNQ